MSFIKGSIGGWHPISIQKICQNTKKYFGMVFENEVGTMETHIHIYAVSEVQTSIIIQDASRFYED